MAPLPGMSSLMSRHTKYPSQTHLPRITLFAICLLFPSPPLHLCRFICPMFSVRLFFACFLWYLLPLCLKLGRLSLIRTIVITWETSMLLMILLKNPPSYILKSFESVVVILLEKGLFKISLLVPVLCSLWVDLFFIELVVLRMLSLC